MWPEGISGGLAQLGERLPCKQEVSGSIPLISTSTGPKLSWLERATDNRKVGGSSPLGPTRQQKLLLDLKTQRKLDLQI